MTSETHPLMPFLPSNAKVLFLGTFPPSRTRWSMDFFYPNWINDFWRIMGIVFFDSSSYFELKDEKRFDKDKITQFCNDTGIAIFDTATDVCRLMDNASDKFLQVVKHTDVKALLDVLPECKSIVTTGGKASEELALILGISTIPEVGKSIQIDIREKSFVWSRVPSSSRAYPMKLQDKALIYKKILSSIFFI